MRLYNGVHLLGSGPSLHNVERIDLNAIPMISHMMQHGLQVDLSHFDKMDRILTEDMERLTEDVHTSTGHYVNLGSGDQVADLLHKRLGIKQARARLTPSGDREAVDHEALVAIQHEHECIPLIMEYKEVEKLRGTYVRPMPKLARRWSDGKYFMYPNLGQTRIPSSRLNCKEPNLLAMPNRTERGRQICEGFICDSNQVYLSVDFCFHPSTLVETLLGPKPIGDLTTQDKVLTHRNDYIKWGMVSRSKSVVDRRAFRVTFDNNESVIASFDHRWPVRVMAPGKSAPFVTIEKRTEDLVVGQHMVPCKRGINGPKKYLTWYSKGYTYYTKHHVMVAEAYLGSRPEGYEIHHKDEDPHNNHPSNLEYKLGASHKSDHGRENYKKQDHTDRLDKLRIGLKERRSYEKSDNPNAKLSGTDWDNIRKLSANGVSTRILSDTYGVSMGYIRDIVRYRRGPDKLENHRIIAIADVGIQPMWAITVEPDHNYVLSCGVVTHNSQIEPRVTAHISQDPNLLHIYNHNEDIYSDFATSAFQLGDKRFPCGGFGIKRSNYTCDNREHKEQSWHYPTVHKKDHRFPAKTCILASFYDVSPGGLLEQMPVICGNCRVEATKHRKESPNCKNFFSYWTEDMCQDLINQFGLRYEGAIRMRMKAHRQAKKHAMVWDLFGRILHITAVRSVHQWVVNAALREAANFWIQSTAQGIMKLAMARVFDELRAGLFLDIINPVLQIHDELLFVCLREYAEEMGAFIADIFESIIELLVPIKAAVAMADSWGLMPK